MRNRDILASLAGGDIIGNGAVDSEVRWNRTPDTTINGVRSTAARLIQGWTMVTQMVTHYPKSPSQSQITAVFKIDKRM